MWIGCWLSLSRSWFPALIPIVLLDLLARPLVCPGLARPITILYVTEDRLPIATAHCTNPLLAEPLPPPVDCQKPVLHCTPITLGPPDLLASARTVAFSQPFRNPLGLGRIRRS